MEVRVLGAASAALKAVLTAAGAQVSAADATAVADAPRLVVSSVADEAAAAAVAGRVSSGAATLLVGAAAARFADLAGEPGVAAVASASERAGWRATTCDPRCKLVKPEASFYFPAAAATLRTAPLGWAASWTVDGGAAAIASLEKLGNPSVAALQFAPELSGSQGKAVLSKWLSAKPSTATSAATPARFSVGATVAVGEAVDAVQLAAADHVVVLGAAGVADIRVYLEAGLPLVVEATCPEEVKASATYVLDGGAEATRTLRTQTSEVSDEWVFADDAATALQLSGGRGTVSVPLSQVAAAKGAALASAAQGSAVRVPPSGLQYHSTNLQCLVPELAASVALPAQLQRYSTVGSVSVVEAAADEAVSAVLKEQFRLFDIVYEGPRTDTVDAALDILNQGAAKVVLSTAEQLADDFVSALPRERVAVALDASACTDERIAALAPHAGRFHVAVGAALDLVDVARMARACRAGKSSLAVRVAAVTPKVLAALDELGVECLVAQAQLEAESGLPLSAAITAIVKTDRTDGLYPTVVVDSESGRALGMCYSNEQSIHEAVTRGKGVYWSRNRGLWVKGETSGDVQELVSVALDCDRDCLVFAVKQTGNGFCHRMQKSCFGPAMVCHETHPPHNHTCTRAGL